MDLEPNITICVTTYNRKNLLPITINSILTQSYDNFEIIIVDDYSTDGTEELVKHTILTMDSRIRYIRHEKNKGLATARNTAIFNAKGRYFTFVDDDDTWAEDFLDTFIRIASKHSNQYVFCASSISKHLSIYGIEASLKTLLILGYTPPVASQFYSTQTLKKIKAYDESISSGVDHDLWLSLGAVNINIIWLNKNLVNVNQINSANRMTYNKEKRKEGIKSSLIIWRKRLINNYNEDFFNCLEKNYDYNTYKKFMLHAFNQKQYLKFLLDFLRLPKLLLLVDIKRYIQRRIFNNSMLNSPVFFSCSSHTTQFTKTIKIIQQ